VNPSIAAWSADWAWGLPLIVLTVVIHVLGLGLFNERAIPGLGRIIARGHRTSAFIVVMGATVLLATLLHGLEAAIWAGAFRLLGALPDNRTAMLYSLGSMTTYGHANVFLAEHWQLMGALEALNGIILFGMTTAFLFATIQRVWPLGHR
jgi:MFS superfamily sulfate permease-like transporter